MALDQVLEQLALTALGGATGTISKSAADSLWTTLRMRLSRKPRTVDVLERRDPANHLDVEYLTEVLRKTAAVDPALRTELERWWAASMPLGPSTNLVQDSQGVNAPGGTFSAPVTVNLGQRQNESE